VRSIDRILRSFQLLLVMVMVMVMERDVLAEDRKNMRWKKLALL
jgi:hypothetical protein